MGFPQCVETRAEILNMLATAWVGTDVRHHGLGASQLRSMKATGLLGNPRGLDQLVPDFNSEEPHPRPARTHRGQLYPRRVFQLSGGRRP